MTDEGYPTPFSGSVEPPPYEWHAGPASVRAQAARLLAAVGAASPLLAIWTLLFSRLAGPGPVWVVFLATLALVLGAQLLGGLGAWAYESAYPLPVSRLGVSPLGVYLGAPWAPREVPWTHATLLGDRLIVFPPRVTPLQVLWVGWWTAASARIRVFHLTDEQAARAHALRPTGL